MQTKLKQFKGLHPGIVLGRELKKRKIPSCKFAISIGEYPQTLNAILHERRGMNTPLSLKIEKAMQWDDGTLMTLQIFYEINKIKQQEKHLYSPDISKLRPVLFWDTNINSIDWVKQKRAVIERVFERGNTVEQKEIIRFYGKNTIEKYAKHVKNKNS